MPQMFSERRENQGMNPLHERSGVYSRHIARVRIELVITHKVLLKKFGLVDVCTRPPSNPQLALWCCGDSPTCIGSHFFLLIKGTIHTNRCWNQSAPISTTPIWHWGSPTSQGGSMLQTIFYTKLGQKRIMIPGYSSSSSSTLTRFWGSCTLVQDMSMLQTGLNCRALTNEMSIL